MQTRVSDRSNLGYGVAGSLAIAVWKRMSLRRLIHCLGFCDAYFSAWLTYSLGVNLPPSM
jgi:hypothetical protein